jgi:3-hydroxybutyryl-CoA dehydrogenase
MPEIQKPAQIPVGIAGLGLMGTSITACLLAAGHPVTGVETNRSQRGTARRRVAALLAEMQRERLLTSPVEEVMQSFQTASDVGEIGGSSLVIEAIPENGEQKRLLLDQIESEVAKNVPIGCNTSAIPISILQGAARNPRRILGIHWAEPAHTTRFLEVICGKATSLAIARRICDLSRQWGKEPTFLKRDIRGFITNRCFYALLREALYLVENGYATVADVDRSLRNDLGYWITFAGPFRFMDLTGIPAYDAVATDLFPELSIATEVPTPLRRLARSGAKGVSNSRGFYKYSPGQAERWEKLFLEFSYRIRALAQEYPEDIGDRPVKRRKSR